jgi:glycosyltransferase involved in cell wall biosynthesis
MHCGACARDLALVRGLRALGHDVLVLPLYTPLRGDGAEAAPGRVFYSGVSVFLEQVWRGWQRPPAWLDRLLSSPRVLRALAGHAVEVRAERLGPLTVSVLAGGAGRQAWELEKLLRYLETEERPDVVSLTNSLLSGIAPAVKARLGVPVVCSLQGEESFLGALPEPHRSQAERLVRENARAIDRFVAPSAAYAAQMAAFLGLSEEQVGVVPPGIDAAAFGPAPPGPPPPSLGYLSVIIPPKGLDRLVAAFLALAPTHGELRLRVAGQVLNRRYWAGLKRQIHRAGLASRLTFAGEVDAADKRRFLQGCGLFCLPTRIPEARGIAVMEALAAGVPVVVPPVGIFPELLERTGGGLLAGPGALAETLERLLDDPAARARLGQAGAAGVARHYSVRGMAQAMLEQITHAVAGAARA